MNAFEGKYGPLLIAEIGGNHEGDFDYAMRLAELAVRSDSDYIKFQLYTGDTLVSEQESPDRNKHFKKFQLTKEQYFQLADYCKTNGKNFLASVWDVDMLDWIDPYLPLYKIGSGDLTAYPVLEAIAKRNKPIIISTGLATEEEVLQTVNFLQKQNKRYTSPDQLAILQCTSMYPIPLQDANLAVMLSLRKATGLTVGYSDHTEGSKALEVAFAMGAQILEFHFTDDRTNKTFRDHKVSLTAAEVHQLQAAIADIRALQGSAEKRPLAVEGDHVVSFRRAVYPKYDLPVGTLLNSENLTVLRPNHGIDAREYDKVLGKKLKEAVKRHQKLTWNLFEN
jgi:N,N'-diacetyllegionaminate synthase